MRRTSVAIALVTVALVGCGSNDSGADSTTAVGLASSAVVTNPSDDVEQSSAPVREPVTEMITALPEFTDRPVVLWFWAPG